MTANTVDASNHTRIGELGERVLNGGHITRDEATWLFHLETPRHFDLLSGPTAVREHFKGNKIHLCSIVNAKAARVRRIAAFCAQSSFYQTGSPKYGFVDPEPVQEAAEEANRNGVTAVGLGAA
jgi:Biotin synthase and related enzymes